FIGISEIIKTHNEDDIILIHDAARPFITEKIITDSIKAVKQYGACATAIQSTDTVFACKDDCVESVLNRENIYLAQTPQGFYLGDIYKAHLNNTMQATDDVSLYLSLGKKVKLIEGDTKNFKLTTMDDYKIAKSLLE
ncbi:MAG: 2-C-methyl-D-erythritol 4-phosphate cytidylyltransferase, partial [Oscillospiraceae bacterium]